jgi:hypothetical protein
MGEWISISACVKWWNKDNGGKLSNQNGCLDMESEMADRRWVENVKISDASENSEHQSSLLRIPNIIPISPNDLEYQPAKNSEKESGIWEQFFSERPSIANPYGRAMVNEEVDG